ncbi:MAG: iron complex outermembrane receptor protein [Halieaceae bacterium]|jgi:iron complex outermembrane receptor protein
MFRISEKQNPLTLAVKAATCVIVSFWAVQAGAQNLVLEEIVVTAQKRAQSLQDVPIAVSAISGEKIVEAGIQGMEDLSSYVPNFNLFIQPGGGSPAAIFIRGIGSGNNVAFEQSVGMFIDGVYTGRSQQYLVPFLDVASVEVLKGPQGALFGKNTVAGAMIINSARPTDEFEAELRAQHEFEYGTEEYAGMVSGPLTDRLSGRLAGRYRDQGGYMDNLVRNSEEPEVESMGLRGSLLFDASDALQIYGKVEYAEVDRSGANGQLTDINGNFRGILQHKDAISPLEDARFDQKNSSNSFSPEGAKLDSFSTTVQIDWDVGENTLVSLTNYSEYDTESVLDGDFSDLLFIEQRPVEEFEQFSQEFRFASPGGEVLDYIVGAYFESQEVDSDNPTDLNLIALSAVNIPGSPVPAVQLSIEQLYTQESDTAAVFGEVSWQITNQLTLTAGARYSNEDKEADRTVRLTDFKSTQDLQDSFTRLIASGLLGRAEFVTESDRSSDNLSYSANLAWDFNDDSMAYLRLARGYKTGGFNAAFTVTDPLEPGEVPDDFEYDDEEVDSIELGAKMVFLDVAAELNVAVFYTELKDLQVSTFVDSGFVVGNAAASTSKGIEVEGRWAATPYLNFSLSVAYLDSTYDDFPDAPCTANQLLRGDGSGSPEDTAAVAGAGCQGYTGGATGTTNLKGNVAGRAPEYSATFISNLVLPVGDTMLFRASVDLQYEDEVSLSNPQNYQDSYHKINARLGLASKDQKWAVALIGKNLTDETTFGNGAGVGFFTGSWFKNRQEPRTVAFDVTYRF